MIGPALLLELRGLSRSPAKALVVALVLVVGVSVTFQGQQDVHRWEQAIASARADQEEALDEARALFEAGELSPEERPWVDLSQARWQDSYAATRLVREPAPLAGIAFASAEAGAVAVRVSRYADPLLAQGSQLENPELATTGGLDLVTVLALLLPLVLLALGVEVGGHERAAGLLPLIRVQSGSDAGWIRARCLAIGCLGALVGLILVATAGVITAADLTSLLWLALLVLGYVAVWTGLVLVVAQVARHPAQAAVALGGAWIVLCVVLPAVGVELSAALAADDFALDLTVEARDASQAARALDEAALYNALFARFPELEELAPEDRARGARTAREGLRIVSLEERLTRREERGQAQAGLVAGMGWASPTVAFSQALERLAGRDPQAAAAFRRAVVFAAADRMERNIAGTWSPEPLGAREFEALHAATPTAVAATVGPAWRGLAVLLVWAGALTALTLRPRFGSSPAAELASATR